MIALVMVIPALVTVSVGAGGGLVMATAGGNHDLQSIRETMMYMTIEIFLLLLHLVVPLGVARSIVKTNRYRRNKIRATIAIGILIE